MAIIRLENISKRYLVHRKRQLISHWAWGRRQAAAEPFWALRDVSFTVDKGETIGIIGHNGAGKSTLIEIIVGVTTPTTGVAERKGRIGAMLELGSGFHPDLTGAENVHLNAALHGMRRAEIERKFASIVEFSELEAFMDEPVRTYSSGMLSRLGFSVAVHLDAKVIALDEVLAVGGKNFQSKCAAKIREFVATGMTILLVSHSLANIEKICSRTIWLDHGRVKMDGATDDVVAEYEQNITALSSSDANKESRLQRQ